MKGALTIRNNTINEIAKGLADANLIMREMVTAATTE